LLEVKDNIDFVLVLMLHLLYMYY